MQATAAVIMAAGQGTRMVSALPKVLHEVCGRPMLAYAIDACRGAGVEKLLVVVGYEKEALAAAFASDGDLVWIEQAEQKGTGHAVLMCREALGGFDGHVLVLAGDMPLVRSQTLRHLLETHEREKAVVSLATTLLADPTGYGRIVRDAAGRLRAIVEHRDCTPEQLAIKEVNPSYYCFERQPLFAALAQIRPDNAKGEYYITDAVKALIDAGHRAAAVTAVPPEEATGINSRRDLAVVSRIMQDRIQERLMDSGVTIADPANTWIDARAEVGRGTVILPFTYIAGPVRIGCDCRVGPFAHLEGEVEIESGAVVGADGRRCR